MNEPWRPSGAAAPVARLIEELHRLPGIGPKGAQRLAYHLLRASKEEANALAEAILEVKERITLCSVCQNTTDVDPCSICSDTNRDRTVICVAHRLSTLRNMDRIIVLARGRIAEEGTFDELLRRGGVFADMARRQGIQPGGN